MEGRRALRDRTEPNFGSGAWTDFGLAAAWRVRAFPAAEEFADYRVAESDGRAERGSRRRRLGRAAAESLVAHCRLGGSAADGCLSGYSGWGCSSAMHRAAGERRVRDSAHSCGSVPSRLAVADQIGGAPYPLEARSDNSALVALAVRRHADSARVNNCAGRMAVELAREHLSRPSGSSRVDDFPTHGPSALPNAVAIRDPNPKSTEGGAGNRAAGCAR